MANNKKNNDVKKTASTLNSRWLQNTLKSMGVAGTEIIKDLMPATGETISSATQVASEAINAVNSARIGTDKIVNNIKNSSAVKMGQDFFKNALEDIKSGNIYNTEREMSFGGDGDFDIDADTLFGDIDEAMFGDGENGPDISVVNQEINQGGAATIKAIERSTEYQVRSSKATVDTMVSIASTSIMSANKIGAEVISQLNTINSNLAAIIEYNNTNMTKFIEASIGYYEQMSAKPESNKYENQRITADEIFTSSGGLDFSNYKEYIKANIKANKENSLVGGALSMIIDNKDLLFGNLVSNPLGTILKGSMKAIIPQVTKKAMESLDNTMKNFIPVMLERIGSLEDELGPNAATSFISNVFGIKTKRKKNFDLSKIEKGPVPFNGYANHTIVEIIPKYLRESNAYLREIAEAVTGKNNKDLRATETGFDWETGTFKNLDEMRKNVYDEIQARTTSEFRNSKFGDKMSSQVVHLKSEKDQQNYDNALDQLYTAIERHRGKIDFGNKEHMAEIMGGINASDSIKNLIESYIEHLQATSDEAIGNAIATKQKATRERNQAMRDVEESATERGIRQFIDKGSYDAYIKEKYSGTKDASISGGRGETKKVNVSIPSLLQGIQDTLNRGIYVQIKARLGGSSDSTYSNQAIVTKSAKGFQPKKAKGSLGEAVQTKDEFKNAFYEVESEEATIDQMTKSDNPGIRERFGRESSKQINAFKGVLDGIMAGNSDKAFEEFMNGIRGKFRKAGEFLSEHFFTPIKKHLFGEKDENGYRTGGIFEGVNNRMKESFYSFRRLITGKGYIDADGNRVEDANEEEMKNTVAGKLKGMLGGLKDGIREKLFGKKAENEDEEDKEGLLPKAKKKLNNGISSLLQGITGWKHALFGKSDDEDADPEEEGKKTLEKLKEKAKDVLPSALTGSLVGGAGGALAGGYLGIMVGGPIGGALLGLAGGIASRSDKFKDWLFGPEDKDGKRVGGVISEKVQDYVKENGKYLAGGAAIGMAKNIITGNSGGLLGTLVGGPVAGAIMGIGTSMLIRSDMFQKFLFGDEKSGQKGLVNTVKGWFGKLGKNKAGDPSGGKLAGMMGIGAGAGAITGAMISKVGILGLSLGPMGPIGGALVGLGGAILAQKKNFKEWLFGKVDPETGIKKAGILGKFANMLTVTVFQPMKNTMMDLGRRFKTFFYYDVLSKFNLILEPIGKAIFGGISKMTGKAINSLAGIGDVIKEDFLLPAIEKVKGLLKPITSAVSTVAKGIYTIGTNIIKAPINLLYGIVSPIGTAIAKTIGGVAKGIAATINYGIIKPIKNLVVKPMIGAVKLATNVITAPFKIIGNFAQAVTDKISKLTNRISIFVHNVAQDFKEWVFKKNPLVRGIKSLGAKVKDFGARIKTTFKILVSPLTDFVKTSLTEVKNHLLTGVKKFFSFLNPLNWIKGIYGLITGNKNKKEKDPSKMGYFRRAWWKAGNMGLNDAPEGMSEDGSLSQRRAELSRRRKYDRQRTYYYDKDGNEYKPSRDGKYYEVTGPDGSTKIIPSDELPDKSTLTSKTYGVDGKIANKEKRQLEKNRQKNRALIAKATKYSLREDTLENREIARQMMAKKGKTITFADVETEDEAIRMREARLQEDTLDATEGIKDNTQESKTTLRQILDTITFGMTMSPEEREKLRTHKQIAKKKAAFLGGYDGAQAKEDAEQARKEAEELAKHQAETMGTDGYNNSGRKSRKKTNDRYSDIRTRQFGYNFTKHGFFGGLKSNWNNLRGYWKGGMSYVWGNDFDSEKANEDQNQNPSDANIPKHATGTAYAKAGPAIVGERGPEALYMGSSSTGRIVGMNGPEVINLKGGETIIPNEKIGKIPNGPEYSNMTDENIEGASDPRKLGIGERIIRELLNIKKLTSIGVLRDNALSQQMYPDEFESYNDGEYDTTNLRKLGNGIKHGFSSLVRKLPGSGIVMRGSRRIGNILGAGKTTIKAGNELFRMARGKLRGNKKRVPVHGRLFVGRRNAIPAPSKSLSTDLTGEESSDDGPASLSDSRQPTLALPDNEKEKSSDAQLAVSSLTAENRHAEVLRKSEEESDNARGDALLESVHNIEAGQKKYTGIWDSIFGKKGLITGGLLFIAPYIFKFLKGFLGRIGLPALDTIVNALGSLKDTFVKWGIGFKEDFKFGINNLGDGDSVTDKLLDNLKRGTSAYDENGNVDHQTDARQKLRDKLIAQKIASYFGKNADGLIDETSKKVGATNLINLGKEKIASSIGAKVESEVAETGMRAVAKEGAEAAATKIATEDSLWTKVMTMIKGAFKDVCDTVAKRSGGSRAASTALQVIPDNVVKNVGKCKGSFSKVSGKISSILGLTAGLGATVVGLAAKEVTWIAVGALNGATGAARLFRVDNPDNLMMVISTIIGGLAGTTIGSIVDVINELVVSVLGIDMISQLATLIYSAIMRVSGNEEAADALRSAQDEFQQKFEKDKVKMLESQYKTMKAAGLLDKGISQEQFIQGANEGKYGAEIQSFADYNDEQHKTFGAKINESMRGSMKELKRTFIGEKKVSYTDKRGNTYTQNDDGTYKVTTSKGEDLGFIGKDAIPEDAVERVEKTEGVLIEVGKAIVKFVKPFIKMIGAAAPSITKSLGYIISGQPMELIKSEVDIDDDVPMSGIAKALAYTPKFLGIVPSVMTMITKEAMKTIGPILSTAFDIVSGVSESVSNGINCTLKGDLKSLWTASYGGDELTFTGTVTKILGTIPKLIFTVPAAMSWLGHALWDNMEGIGAGAADILTSTVKNGAKIFKYVFTGDPVGMWKDSVDVNEDNPLGFVAKGVSIGSKLVATIPASVSWVGHTVRDGIAFIGNSARELFIDTAKNNFEIMKYIRRGDPVGMWKDDANISDDNPLGFVVKGLSVGAKTLGTIPASISWAGHKVLDGIKFIGNTAKTTFTDTLKNSFEILKYISSGDVVGMWKDDANVSDNNPLGFIVKGLSIGAKTLGTIPASVSWVGHKIWDGIKYIDKSTFNLLGDMTDNFGKIWGFVKSGHPIDMWKDDAEISEENPLGFIVKASSVFAKLLGTIPASVSAVGHFIWDPIKKLGNSISVDWGKTKASSEKISKLGSESRIKDLWNVSFECEDGDLLAPVFHFMDIVVKLFNTLKGVIYWIPEKIKDAWGEAKEIAGDVADWLGFGDGDEEKPSTASASLSNAEGGNGVGRPTLRGGMGEGNIPSEMNEMAYFSQNDPRWANSEYENNSDDATIGDSGCGPTAMAMITSEMNPAKNSDPVSIAKSAIEGGYRDETGTNKEFVQNVAEENGLTAVEYVAPSVDTIKRGLSTNNPILMLGQSDGSADSPYTVSGHYLVANGIDGNNVILNDPRGVQYSRPVDVVRLASQTSSVWTFSRKNSRDLDGSKHDRDHGRLVHGQILGKRPRRTGGFGGVDPQTIIDIALSEVGYREHKTNADLDSKDKNTGSGSYNKYSRDLYGNPQMDWCAAFVTWCFYTALGKDKDAVRRMFHNVKFGSTSSCGALKKKFQADKSYHNNTPSPGDLIFFDWGSDGVGVVDHVGIVVGFDGKTVTSCEGNSGDSSRGYDSVCLKAYDIKDSDIDGFGRPNYTGAISWDDVKRVNFDEITKKGFDGSKKSKSGFSALTQFTSLMGKLTSALFDGILTGNWDIDWDSVFSDGEDTTTDTSSSTVIDGTDATVAEATPEITDSNERQLYRFLLSKGKGLSHEAVSAIMGNIYAMSGLRSNNLEDSAEAALKTTDDKFTKDIDDNLTGKNSKSARSLLVDNKYGYGLANFNTKSLKEKLFDAALKGKTSISDPFTQLQILYDFLKTNSPDMLYSDDLRKASDAILNDYQKPEGDFTTISDERYNLAKMFYDKFKNEKLDANSAGDVERYYGVKSSDSTVDTLDYPKDGISLSESDKTILKNINNYGLDNRVKAVNSAHDAELKKLQIRNVVTNVARMKASEALMKKREEQLIQFYKNKGYRVPESVLKVLRKDGPYQNLITAVLGNKGSTDAISAQMDLQQDAYQTLSNLLNDEMKKDKNIKEILEYNSAHSDSHPLTSEYFGDVFYMTPRDRSTIDLLRILDGIEDIKNDSEADEIISTLMPRTYGRYYSFNPSDSKGYNYRNGFEELDIPNSNGDMLAFDVIKDAAVKGLRSAVNEVMDMAMYNNGGDKSDSTSDNSPWNEKNGHITADEWDTIQNHFSNYKSAQSKSDLVRIAQMIGGWAGLLFPPVRKVYGGITNVASSKLLTGLSSVLGIKKSGVTGFLSKVTGGASDLIGGASWNANAASEAAKAASSAGKGVIGTGVNKAVAGMQTKLNSVVGAVESLGMLGGAYFGPDMFQYDAGDYKLYDYASFMNKGANAGYNDFDPSGVSIIKRVEEAYRNYNNRKNNVDQKANDQSSEKRRGQGGGFGDNKSVTTPSPTKLNGSTYYSQNDPRWADRKFIRSDGYDDSATISDSGCGPTAMAMAISDTTGQTVTPTEMARLAQITGDRDETGVNWNFINNAANYYGVHTLQSTNPTREFIESSLNTGSPVVLSGQSDGDVNSPYTSSGHYVVAVGKDRNGNAIINDPRGRNYSKSISIDNLVGHTGSAWLVGNKNTSTLPVSIRYEKRGGRGDDYLTWLQSDPRWADKKLGSSGETMKTAGCAVTTVAKLTVYSQSITDSSYNPGYLCDYLNSNGGLDGNGCINWGAAPGLKHEGRGDFNNPSKEEVIKRIGELMSSGYYVALCVDNGGHYVAVIKVTNDGIVMSDPAQNSTTNLFDKYSAQSCDSYHYFSGAKSPQDIGNSTGAKSSTDTMSRIASIFGKYGSAIFKSAYTGDWNINWDDVFAEDASTDASVTTGVPGDDVTLSGSDNAEKIRNYLRGNLGFTEAGAAGVMGNWMVESGLEPGNLENTFETGGSNAISPGYTDESYVAAIDSKKYTKTQFMSDANHVPSYVANCGSPVGAGFGLGQWTTGQRKGELYDATVGKGMSIASLSGQLNYAMKELMSGTEKYNALLSTLRSTDSYNVAAEEFLAKFEGCPGHSSLPKRQANAKDFYNRFNGKTVQGGKGEGPKNDEEQPKPIGTGCPKPKKGTKEAIEFKKNGGKGDGPTINTNKYSLRPLDIELNDNPQTLQPIQATPSAAMTAQQRSATQNSTSAYSNESMERLMKEIIGILGVISNNSGNLSLLEDIRSGLSGNTNNIVSNTNNTTVNANGKTKTKQTSQTSTRMSRDEEAARRIAFGN